MMDIIVSNDCISLLSNFPFTVIIELITFLFYHRKTLNISLNVIQIESFSCAS